MSKILKRVPLGQQIANDLRDSIVRREIPDGFHVVEEALTSRYGVSRGPVRDAIRILENEGLIEVRNPGAFVTSLDVSGIQDLYLLRERMEALAIELCMERATTRDWDHADDLLEQMAFAAKQGDARLFTELDMEIHSQFYNLSQHQRLAQYWQQFKPTIASLVLVTSAQGTNLEQSAKDHVRLVSYVRDKDLPQALTELRWHLDVACNIMCTNYEGTEMIPPFA